MTTLLVARRGCGRNLLACGLRFAAQRGHGGVIRGDEVADHDAHGAGGQRLAGDVVVRGADAQLVAGGKFVPAALVERDYRDAQQLALFIDFGVQRHHLILARHVFQRDLLGVGGHMLDYAKQITLEDVTRKDKVVTLDAKVDEKGQLLSIPVVTFYERGGYKFTAGDQLRITATYDNITGKPLPSGAMGIVVGYFVPADDSAMSALRRKPKSAGKQVAAATPSRDQ